ncbi:MAG: hypothetical protein AAFX79_12805 [Planctomycetota bacterium]
MPRDDRQRAQLAARDADSWLESRLAQDAVRELTRGPARPILPGVIAGIERRRARSRAALLAPATLAACVALAGIAAWHLERPPEPERREAVARVPISVSPVTRSVDDAVAALGSPFEPLQREADAAKSIGRSITRRFVRQVGDRLDVLVRQRPANTPEAMPPA